MQIKGLNYFPFLATNDDDMKLFIARFSPRGFGILVLLLQKLFCQNGYYYKATNDTIDLFASEINVKSEHVLNIINYLVLHNYFNKDLYEKYSILTSDDIQMNYLKVAERRQVAFHNLDYVTPFVNNLLKNVNKSNGNDNKKGKNVNNAEQNKTTGRKETKQTLSVNYENNNNLNACTREEIYNTFKNHFSEFYEWCFSAKYTDIANEILNVMTEAQIKAGTEDKFKFAGKTFGHEEIIAIWLSITTEQLRSIVYSISIKEDIKDRSLYILGCLFKKSEEKSKNKEDKNI